MGNLVHSTGLVQADQEVGSCLGTNDSPALRGQDQDLWRDCLGPLSAHSTIGQRWIRHNMAIEWEEGVVPSYRAAKELALAAILVGRPGEL